MECVSCEEITNKYKCSKCSAAYCSVDCYKKHKDSPQCEEAASAQQANRQAQSSKNASIADEPTIYPPFKTEDSVSLDKLQQLSQCKELRELLHNPHLRSLLQQIDVSHNANLAMTAAMQEPLFVEFANACLQVVEPMTNAERAEQELLS